MGISELSNRDININDKDRCFDKSWIYNIYTTHIDKTKQEKMQVSNDE